MNCWCRYDGRFFPMDDIAKSSRHAHITGKFAEALVLYWLSRDGFECASIDHTGIDLLARNCRTGKLMGISVKSRSRKKGTETGGRKLCKGGLQKNRQGLQDLPL